MPTLVSPIVEQRFWDKVQKSDGCWLWTASVGANGYGQFQVGGNHVVRSHRLAYELICGPIPDGLQLDHKCKNRACVRPDPEHVRPVTHAQNMQGIRAINRFTGHRGVYRAYGRGGVLTGRFVAQVNVNGRSVHVGTYNTIEEAAEAARLKRLEVFTHSDGR